MKKAMKGFSLIEIMVSVAVFSVVIMAGTLSMLSIIDANQKSQSLNSVMTNLNTVLETMAREVRVGSLYCLTDSGDLCSDDQVNTEGEQIWLQPSNGCDVTSDGSGGRCLTYKYNPIDKSIEKSDLRRDSTGEFSPITASEVHITSMTFTLLSSDPTVQPAVLLKLKGYAETKTKTRSDFFLQTLMSQRLIQ